MTRPVIGLTTGYDDGADPRQALGTAYVDAVVRAGGSLSHHHGVGRSKAPAMRAEQGHALDVVRALKATMDPANILNPGVLLGPGPREVA